jgi:hypothetical protein
MNDAWQNGRSPLPLSYDTKSKHRPDIFNDLLHKALEQEIQLQQYHVCVKNALEGLDPSKAEMTPTPSPPGEPKTPPSQRCIAQKREKLSILRQKRQPRSHQRTHPMLLRSSRIVKQSHPVLIHGANTIESDAPNLPRPSSRVSKSRKDSAKRKDAQWIKTKR